MEVELSVMCSLPISRRPEERLEGSVYLSLSKKGSVQWHDGDPGKQL